MSTILKALQRLEDEKTADVERSLDEQIVERRSPRKPDRRRGLGIGIAAIGGLAVAAAAFLLWPSQEDSDAVVAIESPPLVAAPEPAQPEAPAKPRRQRPARIAPAAPEQADSAEIEIASVVEVVERLEAQPADSGAPAASQERVAPATEAKRSDRRPSARKPDTRVANKPEPPRPTRKRASNAEPAVAPVAESSVSTKTAAAPAAPVEIAAVVPEPAPIVASEPIPAPIREPAQKVVQRAKVPSLSIEKTIWHPDTNRRIAVVKLIGTEEVLRLKEGDAIGPLVVESIRPSSVVFNHDGIEISFNVGG